MSTLLRERLAASPLPLLETRMLVQHILGVSRSWLIAHDTDPITDPQWAPIDALIQRRVAGEPMAYLVGTRAFMQWDFEVSPDVLIPRPETELLVETLLHAVASCTAPRLLDLGTGSGAIAISLALLRPDAEVHASDVSPPALDLARRNAERLGAHVHFHQGSWYDALPPGLRFDAIASNPPYISSNDPHLIRGDLRFEPPSALTDFGDGLSALHTLAHGAPQHLQPGGVIWMEHGWDQAEAVRAMLSAAGLSGVASLKDLAGIERISGATL